MAAVARALRDKLGDEALEGLQAFVDDAGRKWKDEVLTLAAERFNNTLAKKLAHFVSTWRRSSPQCALDRPRSSPPCASSWPLNR